MPLIENVLKPLAKCVLIPLFGLTAAAAAAAVTDTDIHKKMFGPGATTLITSNDEMNDIKKIIKSLNNLFFLIKSVSETIKNEAKEQIGGCLGMLLDTLGASLLRSQSTGKGIISAGESTVRGGQGF